MTTRRARLLCLTFWCAAAGGHGTVAGILATVGCVPWWSGTCAVVSVAAVLYYYRKLETE